MSDGLLRGRRVVTTRPDAGDLERRLEHHGATVVHVPLTNIVDVGVNISVDEPIDWLVVTSANGAQRSEPWASLASHRCAVGPSSAAVLREVSGEIVDLVPKNASGEDLVRSFPAAPSSGGHVVIVRGEQASGEVRTGIEQLGWRVTDVVTYRTQPKEVDQHTVEPAATSDLVLLAASSAATAWASTCRTYGLSSPPVVVIGAPTARTAEQETLEVAAIAEPSTIEGLVSATLKYFD
ncbi:MAG: uroporphyrinogen-III synthase [Ilumatobacteraceae bacterium]